MKTVLLLLLIAICNQLFIGTATATTNSVSEAKLKSSAKIECKHGYPKVNIITWKKGTDQIAYRGETVKISPRYELSDGEGVSYLTIKEVLKDDAGLYTCIAFVVGQNKDYQTRNIVLNVKGAGNMVKCSLTVVIFGFLVLKIFV